MHRILLRTDSILAVKSLKTYIEAAEPICDDACVEGNAGECIPFTTPFDVQSRVVSSSVPADRSLLVGRG